MDAWFVYTLRCRGERPPSRPMNTTTTVMTHHDQPAGWVFELTLLHPPRHSSTAREIAQTP